MALATGPDWLTLDAAASLLGVSKVTLHRWVKQGRLRTFRLGPRKVRVRRGDLDALFTPVEAAAPPGPIVVNGIVIERLTEEEKEEQLRVIEQLKAFRDELAAKRGGRIFSSSVPIIRRARAIRSRQLLNM